mgnify:CR=1 FL=1
MSKLKYLTKKTNYTEKTQEKDLINDEERSLSKYLNKRVWERGFEELKVW